MREIKFKAWSKIGAKMSPPVTMKQWCYASYDTTIDPLDDSLVLFLQFTGFRDKNGRELYDGDIIRYFQPSNDFKWESVLVVEWDDDHAGWGFYKRSDSYRGKPVQKIDDRDTPYYASRYEMIGNIYENPDLLSV